MTPAEIKAKIEELREFIRRAKYASPVDMENTLASLEKAVAALEFYAAGKSDLEPKPEKAHLYARDLEMWSPQWIQRSMSDFIIGKNARAALKSIGELMK